MPGQAMIVLYSLLLLCAVAGHIEWVVTLVNRAHATRLPYPVLKAIRLSHDLLVPFFPVVMVVSVGLTGPRLLRGGSWEAVPLGWQIYLGLCGLGFFGMVWAVVRRWFGLPDGLLVSMPSEVVDVAAKLGERPVGAGPYQLLARVPRNEIFQIEVNEKTFQLARLPREWDGLSILHLSDLHFLGTVDKPFFEEAISLARELTSDLVVFTGDLLDDMRRLDWLPDTLGRLSAPLGCHFILGNHDWYLEPEQIRQAVSALGWQDVASRTVTVQHLGHRLVLGGTERPWMGRHPDFSNASGDEFRILLSHTPDHIRWARMQDVDLMLSGHNHGGQVVLPVLGPVYSPSLYGSRFAGGTYWRPPTLLHVSRGLSGRHPLRLNCRPEITRIVLTSQYRGESPEATQVEANYSACDIARQCEVSAP